MSIRTHFYRAFKKIGIFPNAVFDDQAETIDFTGSNKSAAPGASPAPVVATKKKSGKVKAAVIALLFILPMLSQIASAQTSFNKKSKYRIPVGNGKGGLVAIDTGAPGQILTSNGADYPSFQDAAAAGSLYFKDDGGTPVLAPSVTVATKGISIGDSAGNTAYGGFAIGRQSSNTAIDGIAFGSKTITAGSYGVAIGKDSWAKSIGSVAIGWDALDQNTSNVNDGTKGNNIIIGSNANSQSAADLSIAMGYASEVDLDNGIAIGNNAYAKGNQGISIGMNAGTANTANKNNQINITSNSTGTASSSAFDSTFQTTTGLRSIARNTGAYYFGGNNTSGSTDLFVVADGGVYGNPGSFNALRVLRNGNWQMMGTTSGTLTLAAPAVAGTPTLTFPTSTGTITHWVAVPASASSTGVIGDAAYESGFIYICTATDTWQRVAIATW